VGLDRLGLEQVRRIPIEPHKPPSCSVNSSPKSNFAVGVFRSQDSPGHNRPFAQGGSERAPPETALGAIDLDGAAASSQSLEWCFLVRISSQRRLNAPCAATPGTPDLPTDPSSSPAVLMNTPISPSISGCVRPAIGDATATSCWLLQRPSTNCNAANNTMYCVTLHAVPTPQRLRLRSRYGELAPRSTEARHRRRGRSVGNSNAAGIPDSCSCQYVSCLSSSSPCSHCRCHNT